MHHRTLSVALVAAVVTALAPAAPQARAAVSFDWATIGNAGNAPDPLTGFGAVSYEYRIATTEVTNAQYAQFLNAVDPTASNSLSLYNSSMAGDLGGIDFLAGNPNGSKYVVKSRRANNPVTFVSWYDSARFTNWLHNGQGTADTESGTYTLLGGTATPSNGTTVTRNPAADYFLPTEDEWYKAASHDAAAGTAGTYFVYATGSNTPPVSDQPGSNPAAVNFRFDDGLTNGFNDGFAVSGTTSLPSNANPFTNVGAYTNALSPYGTFDQSGNAAEWNQSPINFFGILTRGVRGGSFGDSLSGIQVTSRGLGDPAAENEIIGFRVASTVPEPASALLLVLTAPLLMRRQRG